MEISLQVDEYLRQVDAYVLQALDTEDSKLSAHLHTTIQAGGKRLRPALVLLSARLCDPAVSSDDLLPLAAALEMVHTASLIHDDVIDDSGLRRGQPSLHTRVGRQSAVLAGDYLLAKALMLLGRYRDPALLALLAQAAGEMCLGEFQQLNNAFLLEKQSMAQYFQRIRRKTAVLLILCCRAGALAGQADAASEQALSRYGLYLGLAFQLSDDLLDFSVESACGKPRGQDLRQGIFTPPLLYALKHSQRAAEVAVWAQKRDKSEAELELLLQEVERSGGLAETERLAQACAKKAAAALAVFPASGEKSALLALCDSLPGRKR